MSAFVPYPHVLGVVPAAASLIHRELLTCAQPSAVLPAARLGLDPCRAVQAATHAHVRTAANAECRVECPAEL